MSLREVIVKESEVFLPDCNITKLSLESKKNLIKKISFLACNGVLEIEREKLKLYTKQLSQDENSEIKELIALELVALNVISNEVATKLAHDNGKAAIFVINFYPDFTDDELIKIIHSSKDVEKLLAVAKRSRLSQFLINYLVDLNNIETLNILISNEQVRFPIEIYKKLILINQSNQVTLDMLSKRSDFNQKEVIALLAKIKTQECQRLLKEFSSSLEGKKKFMPHRIDSFNFESPSSEEIALRKKIDHLFLTQTLKPILLLKFLVKADVFSFVYAASKLSDFPIQRVIEILFSTDNNEKEFSNFCKTIQISNEHVSSLKEILNLVTATSDENEEVEAAIRGQIELITDPKTKEEVKKLFSLLG
jgi:uncharacterized protein (DUF2336 family)